MARVGDCLLLRPGLPGYARTPLRSLCVVAGVGIRLVSRFVESREKLGDLGAQAVAGGKTVDPGRGLEQVPLSVVETATELMAADAETVRELLRYTMLDPIFMLMPLDEGDEEHLVFFIDEPQVMRIRGQDDGVELEVTREPR